MELVAEKYKKTELGTIPEDWQITPIGALGSFSKGSGVRKDEAQSGDYPCLRYGEIYTRHNDYIKRFYSFISKEVAERAKRLRIGDILFAGSGETKEEIGKCVAFLDEFEAYAGGDIVILSPTNVSPLFLGYMLNAPFIQKQKASRGQGDAVVHISAAQLGKVKIPLPPTKSEQTAIATALSDMDALISSLEKLIEKKRMIKQGAMQELLKPKEGWVTKSLGEIGEIAGAGVDKLINPGEAPVRLVNFMDVFKRDFIYSEELNHWVTASQQKASKCTVKRGDVFFTPSSEMRYDIAISAVAMEDIPDAVYSYHLVRFRLFEDWDLPFRTYIFKTKYFLSQAEQLCEGSGKRYVITLPKFRSLKIIYPPSWEEQMKIATILSNMDMEISSLEAKLEKCKKVKIGMMQTLLTGKIRLI